MFQFFSGPNREAEFFTDIPRFWHGLKTPNFPLPKTPFKTEWVVEGLWHFDG